MGYIAAGLAASAGDFNNNGAADLAIGVLFEGIGAIPKLGPSTCCTAAAVD